MVLSLKDAEKARDAITASHTKSVVELYKQWAKEVEEKAKRYDKKGTASAPLQAAQLRSLKKAIEKTAEKVSQEVESGVKESIAQASQSVIDDAVEWMKSLGFPEGPIKAAFSSVPDMVVRNIVSGQIYDTGWSLSKNIWSDKEDTLKKVYEVVAAGQAQNKSVYEIAKDLEAFVQPGAKKQWNKRFESVDKVDGKKKLYRVYPKQVDYNAQRLARTLSQHAYQQSIEAVTKDNPFIQKVRWRSTGSRVCDICKARDGKLFDKDKVPMDHPNGMCILEPVVDDDIDDRLIDWVNGKKDKALDDFAKKLGFSVDDMDVKGAGKTSSTEKQDADKDETSKLIEEFEKVKAEYEDANKAIQEAMMKGDIDSVIKISQRNAELMKKHKELSEKIESMKKAQGDQKKREGGHLTKNDFFEGLDSEFLQEYNPEGEQSNREYVGAKLVSWCAEGYQDMKNDYLLEKAISENRNKFQGMLYRGMSVKSDVLASMEPGAEFVQNGLTSWSSEIGSAMEFAYEYDNPVLLIDVTEGSKNAVSIKDFSGRPWENEVLSSGKTKFKITKRYKKTVEYQDRNSGTKSREVIVIEVEEFD